MLIKQDNKHERGVWDDATCKAWARLHATERKKPKQRPLFKEPT
jgi:hypothetical protein